MTMEIGSPTYVLSTIQSLVAAFPPTKPSVEPQGYFLMVDYPTKLTTLQLAESGREASSDHHLLLGTLKGKLRAHRDLTSGPLCKYNTQNLKSKEISETFSCSVKNRYSALEFVDEHIDSHWTTLKHTR